jgi:hypothetical protein
MYWQTVLGSTSCDNFIADEVGNLSGNRNAIHLCDFGFLPLSLKWQLDWCEGCWRIRDFWGMVSAVCGCPASVVRGCAATILSVCGLMNAGTLKLAILYLVSLSWKLSTAYPDSVYVILSCLICYCRQRSMHWCTVVEYQSITQPDLSSSHSILNSESFSLSSSYSP